MKNYFAIFILFVFSLFSCNKKDISPGLTFQKTLILGNSITFSEASPEIGWFGNWGMAASAQNKDFAHLNSDIIY